MKTIIVYLKSHCLTRNDPQGRSYHTWLKTIHLRPLNWSIICVEEDIISKQLEFDCRLSDARQEYATKTDVVKNSNLLSLSLVSVFVTPKTNSREYLRSDGDKCDEDDEDEQVVDDADRSDDDVDDLE